MVIRWKYVLEGFIFALICGMFFGFIFGLLGAIVVYIASTIYVGRKVGGGKLNGALNGAIVGGLGLALMGLVSSLKIGPYTNSGILAAVLVASPFVIILGAIMGAIGAHMNKKADNVKESTATVNPAKYQNQKNFEVDNMNESYTVEMSDYADLIYKLASDLKIGNADELNERHTARCANCNVEFSKEALQQLAVFGPKSNFAKSGSNMMVVGASTEGKSIRSGRCPHCNHSQLIVTMK